MAIEDGAMVATVEIVMSSMAILFRIIGTGHCRCQYQYPPLHDDHCWRVRPQRLGCPTCLPILLVCLLNHTPSIHYTPSYTTELNQTPPTAPCPLVFFHVFGL